MSEQTGFQFDAPLEHIPESQLPPKRVLPEKEALVEQIRAILPDLADDIDSADPLLAIGLPKESIIGWHVARVLDVLLLPTPTYQAYKAGENKMRYRRLPPLECCPGYGDEECSTPTLGGKRCPRHLDMEEESLWNTD